MKDVDVADLQRRHLAGESVKAIAKSLGVGQKLVSNRLKSVGTIPTKRVPLDVADLVRRYAAGESELALSRSLGISRTVIRRRLVESGVATRNGSEANLIRMAKLSPAERLALASAAHAAARGVPKSEEERSKAAQTRQRNAARHATDNERAFGGWLRARGVEVVHQLAIGRYNVDVALTESRIAVEIFGGNWHATGQHAARYRKRCDHLLDRGWLPVIIWVTTRHPLTIEAADYAIALHQVRCAGKARGCQEHVIRGDGHVFAAEVKSDNGALVLGYNPGNPSRGDDGRFR